MGQRRYAKHSAEFRAEAVRSGSRIEGHAPLAKIARELGVNDSTLPTVGASEAEHRGAGRRLNEDERSELQAACAPRCGRCGWSATS